MTARTQAAAAATHRMATSRREDLWDFRGNLDPAAALYVTVYLQLHEGITQVRAECRRER
jgi:hypothetical protein